MGEDEDMMDLPRIDLPLTLDFCSPQGGEHTRISKFFDELRKGKFTTTRCLACGQLNWPPRVVCPGCHSDELEWVDLPSTGTLWAFTEMRLGAPLGFEKDLPFTIGMVQLDGVDIRILTRIDTPFDKLDLNMSMELSIVSLPGDRVIYRFKAKE